MATDDDEIVQIPMDENISPEFVQRALSPSFESENTPKTRGRSAKSSKSNSLERGLNSSGPLLPRDITIALVDQKHVKSDKRDKRAESEESVRSGSKKRKFDEEPDDQLLRQIDKMIHKQIKDQIDRLEASRNNDLKKIESGFRSANTQSTNIQKLTSSIHGALQAMDEDLAKAIETVETMDKRDKHQMRSLVDDIGYIKKSLEAMGTTLKEHGALLANSQHAKKRCIVCDTNGHSATECEKYTDGISRAKAMVAAGKCVTCGDKACVESTAQCKNGKKPCTACPKNSPLSRFHMKALCPTKYPEVPQSDGKEVKAPPEARAIGTTQGAPLPPPVQEPSVQDCQAGTTERQDAKPPIQSEASGARAKKWQIQLDEVPPILF